MSGFRTAGFTQQRGFSLFEVLITVIVISIGLLGLAGLQFAGLRAANSAQEHTLANLLAQDIEERIRANAVGAANGAYNNVDINSGGSYPAVDCYTVACTTTTDEMANSDFNQWYQFIVPNPGEKALLPDLDIKIQSNNNINFQVGLQWGDADGLQSLTAKFRRQ